MSDIDVLEMDYKELPQVSLRDGPHGQGHQRSGLSGLGSYVSCGKLHRGLSKLSAGIAAHLSRVIRQPSFTYSCRFDGLR
ncbi:hypothetical protein MCOR21_001834 [Pyricularia oryzae]|nr:hypothetical protein MCOR21_001834 [Pyricularia oryzae]